MNHDVLLILFVWKLQSKWGRPFCKDQAFQADFAAHCLYYSHCPCRNSEFSPLYLLQMAKTLKCQPVIGLEKSTKVDTLYFLISFGQSHEEYPKIHTAITGLF